MIDFLNMFGFNAADATRIMQYARKHEVGKGDTFVQPSQKVDTMYFLHQGLVRSYRNLNGEDMTYMFYFEADFCVDFYAYLTQAGSDLYFDALVDSTLYAFKRQDVEMLFGEIPLLEKFGRLMAEKAFIIISERFKDMQALEASQRYLKLLHKNPELLQQIPQKYIATYLNVKPESLSRIKRNIAKPGNLT